MLPTPDPPPRRPPQDLRQRVLALLIGEIINEADARVLLSIDEQGFASLCSDEALLLQAQALARTMRLAGDDTSMRAQRLMPDVISRLGVLLADPEASSRTIVEVGRVLAQLSGSAARADASGKLAGALVPELVEVEPGLPLISTNGGPASLLRILRPDPGAVRVKEFPILDPVLGPLDPRTRKPINPADYPQFPQLLDAVPQRAEPKP